MTLSIALLPAEWKDIAELLAIAAAELHDVSKYPTPMRSDLLTKRMRQYAKRAEQLAAQLQEML
jgi:hypothetical protein